MVTEIEMFESQDLTLQNFCFWGWMKSQVLKVNVDTRDEFLVRTRRVRKVKIQRS